MRLRGCADGWVNPAPRPAAAQVSVATPRNVVETTSTQTTLQLVSSSDAIALLPTSVLKTAISAGKFTALPLVIGEPLGYYGVLTRKGEAISDVVGEFIDTLLMRDEP